MDTLRIVVTGSRIQTEMNGTAAEIIHAALQGIHAVYDMLDQHGDGILFRAMLTSYINDKDSPLFKPHEKEAVIKDEGYDLDLSLLGKLRSLFQPTTEEEETP